MAAALAAMRGPPATSGVCFSCGKPGHLKRDCPAPKRDKPGVMMVSKICARCCRGPHSPNQCPSKYDSEGRLPQGYQGNWNQGMGRRRHTLTRMPQPPLQTPAPQMPAPQIPASQMSSTSVPQVFA
ncbi:GAK10 protein, partial [Aphelocoma coerulescens]|nr:GAK10 protein [Aphelocoma coerulescens]